MHGMVHRLKKSGLAAHVVDGPQGPAGVVKAGVIRMASAADAVIVPFCVSVDKAWYFNSWDTFMLPKPFARITLRFDDMMVFPVPETKDAFETRRALLEKKMRPFLHQKAAGTII